MEIEVKKIKCTKSMVKQMQCTIHVTKITECEVLGYIRNLEKGVPKLILIKTATGQYCTVPPDVKVRINHGNPLYPDSHPASFCAETATKRMNFDNEAALNYWAEQYRVVLKLATEQIYV